MDYIFSDQIVRARKNYQCDACRIWLSSGYTLDDCEKAKLQICVSLAEQGNWEIRPGQYYRKVTGIYNGAFCTYRCRLDMDYVCSTLDLYGE